MPRSPSHERFATICIGDMTCSSCELLLEKRLRAVPGITHVDVDHKAGTARIAAKADELPNEERIVEVIEAAGYSVIDEGAPSVSSLSPDRRKWMEIGGSLLIIFALYKILQAFDLIALAPSTSGVLSLGGIFIIGLVAGTSSCLAVTGGLLIALAAKYSEIHQAKTAWRKFQPLLHFNLGRLVSYFVLGGLVGVIGQSIMLSPRMSGHMSIMTIPALGVSQALRGGENIIEFTPPRKGPLAFMCSMGMVRGSFNVI